MIKVNAGETVTGTWDLSLDGSESLTAYARDQRNKPMTATVSISAPNATVTIASSEWATDASGYGRIEVMSGTSTVVSEKFRVERGLSVSDNSNDYGG